VREGGRPIPVRGSGGVTPGNFFEIFDAKSRIWGQFGPENKLIEGQPNEYDVICRNASVLAFHLWPTIFAGAPFWLQNICRNGVPTPLHPYSYPHLVGSGYALWSVSTDVTDVNRELNRLKGYKHPTYALPYVYAITTVSITSNCMMHLT